MIRIGYALSSEEHPPNELVDHARQAQERGFEVAVLRALHSVPPLR
jgi:coenzyme F420-dependent glucose-6-phosphate dehydrogenase